jgi:hypothetical protein
VRAWANSRSRWRRSRSSRSRAWRQGSGSTASSSINRIGRAAQPRSGIHTGPAGQVTCGQARRWRSATLTNRGDGRARGAPILLYPNTPLAAWFEVKGTFPGPEELRKAQALSQGTGLRVYVYFAELGLPAPATLADMSAEEFMDHEEERF